MAVLVPALVSLRSEFNTLAPNRDKGAEGWIGDAAHQGTPSGHNPDETGVPENYDSDNIDEVRAIDVDKDLRKKGWDMQRCVDIIVDRHKRGVDNRLDYIIYNHWIYERLNGWNRRRFDDSPHEDHAHFSSLPGSGSGTGNPENRTQPWGLLAAEKQEEDNVAAEQDMVTVSRDTEVALFGGKDMGEVSMATLTQLNGIWAKRAADNGAKAIEAIQTLTTAINQLNTTLKAAKLPPAPPAQ